MIPADGDSPIFAVAFESYIFRIVLPCLFLTHARRSGFQQFLRFQIFVSNAQSFDPSTMYRCTFCCVFCVMPARRLYWYSLTVRLLFSGEARNRGTLICFKCLLNSCSCCACHKVFFLDVLQPQPARLASFVDR